MSDKKKLLDDFRVCIAGILNIAVDEMTDENKIRLAQILHGDPSLLRLHVQLEPLVIVAAVFAPDRKTPVELFRIIDVPKEGNFN